MALVCSCRRRVFWHVETSRIQEKALISGHASKQTGSRIQATRQITEAANRDAAVRRFAYHVPRRSTRPELICMPCDALMGPTAGSQECAYSTSRTRQTKARPKHSVESAAHRHGKAQAMIFDRPGTALGKCGIVIEGPLIDQGLSFVRVIDLVRDPSTPEHHLRERREAMGGPWCPARSNREHG